MRRGQASPYLGDSQFNWQSVKALASYLADFKVRVLLALGCLILAKISSVGLPVILKHIVDDLNPADSNLAVTLPVALLLAYGVARFSNVLFGEIRDALFGRVTERAMRKIALQVFEHLHQLDISFHLNRQTGGISRDIERGISGISFLLRFMVFNIVPTLLEILFIALLLIYLYSIWFSVIIIIAVSIYIAFSVVATEWRTRFVREANEADSMSNTRAIDSLLNYETVKYFCQETQEAKRYDEALALWEQARRKNRLTLFALNGGQALIISLALLSMLFLAAYYVTSATMTLGDFVLINAYMMQIFLPLNFLGFVYREMKGATANIERMFYLLRLKPEIANENTAPALQIRGGEIQFHEVEFSYEKQGRRIIKNLSFTVPAGKKVAIVGASGSGKSTLSKLLYRFYDCDSGFISIDGQKINEVALMSLREQIGIVPQDCVLFNTTLRENILYGSRDAHNVKDLDSVLKMAHLEQFVASLPQGLETTVGERGLKLSGGEKQRVAIARTLLKTPSIWIFDEATSSLDTQAEKLIVDAINDVTRNKTSLVIAHRLSTIVDADSIFVLDKGELVESGTHSELIAEQGYYQKMWHLQQMQAKQDKLK